MDSCFCLCNPLFFLSRIIQHPKICHLALICNKISWFTRWDQNSWWLIFWQQSALPDIFHLQWSCLKSILLITIITVRNFPDKAFCEANSEFVESEKDYKLFEAEFLRVYELNKQQDSVHHVWCLDPVNMERTSLRPSDNLQHSSKFSSVVL